MNATERLPGRLLRLSRLLIKYMLGLSATPWRRDKLSRLIFWHIGDVHHKIEASDLVETGDILKAEVITRKTDFRPWHDPKEEYTKMISELTEDPDRNLLIASDVALEASNGGGISLVLSDRKAHCEDLQAILRDGFNISKGQRVKPRLELLEAKSRKKTNPLTGGMKQSVRLWAVGSLTENGISFDITKFEPVSKIKIYCRNQNPVDS